MRKDKKIELYVKHHPLATERQLEKKFNLSRSEALMWLRQDNGHDEDGGTRGSQRCWDALRAWFRDEKRTFGTLFVLALVVRLGYAFFVLRDPLLTTPLHDAKYYLLWAQDILKQGWLGDAVFFTEPFYAYLLALFLKVFGDGGVTAILVFQWFVGALVSVGLYLVTKKVFNRQAGLTTGVLAALYGPFLFYEGLLLKTSLEVALLPWFLLFLFFTFEKRQAGTFFVAGLLVGVLSLVKGNNLIFVPVVIGLIWYLFYYECVWMKRLTLTASFTLGVALLIAPVTVRNYVVSHDIVLTNYSFGLVTYQGSWWGGDGSTALVPPFLRPNPEYEETDAVGMAEAYAERTLKPSEVSSFWLNKAMEEVIADPLHFIGSLWNKILILFNHSEFSDNYQFGWYREQVFLLWLLPNFLVVCLFGLFGLLSLLSKRFWQVVSPTAPSPRRKHVFFHDRAFILVSLFLSSIAVLLLTTVNARYRVALVPFLLIFSGGALTYLWGCLREGIHTGLWAFGGGLFVSMLLLWYPLPMIRFDTGAQSYHALGHEALLTGQYSDARQLFETTIAIDPEYAWAYSNLALVALAENRYEEAEGFLKQLIVLRPDDLSHYRLLLFMRNLKEVHEGVWADRVREYVHQGTVSDYDADFNEAERYRRQNNIEQAVALYQRSLSRQPDAPATLIALASLVKQQGKVSEAKKYLQQAVESHPELFPARYNLANIYIEEQNFALVVELLRDIYMFTPELGETWYNYAVAFIKLNRSTEAVPIMRAYIERYRDDPARKSVVEKFRSALKPAATHDLDALIQKR